jgi:hypothetical protein
VLCLALRHAVATAFNGPDREARALEVCPAGNGLRRATRVMAGCLSTPAERACAQHRSATRAPRRFMGGPDLGHASHTAGMFSTNKEAARQQGVWFTSGAVKDVFGERATSIFSAIWADYSPFGRSLPGFFRRHLTGRRTPNFSSANGHRREAVRRVPESGGSEDNVQGNSSYKAAIAVSEATFRAGTSPAHSAGRGAG